MGAAKCDALLVGGLLLLGLVRAIYSKPFRMSTDFTNSPTRVPGVPAGFRLCLCPPVSRSNTQEKLLLVRTYNTKISPSGLSSDGLERRNQSENHLVRTRRIRKAFQAYKRLLSRGLSYSLLNIAVGERLVSVGYH